MNIALDPPLTWINFNCHMFYKQAVDINTSPRPPSLCSFSISLTVSYLILVLLFSDQIDCYEN